MKSKFLKFIPGFLLTVVLTVKLLGAHALFHDLDNEALVSCALCEVVINDTQEPLLNFTDTPTDLVSKQSIDFDSTVTHYESQVYSFFLSHQILSRPPPRG